MILSSCNNNTSEFEILSNENLQIGIEFLNKDNYKDALVRVNKAIYYNSENANAYYYRAAIYTAIDDNKDSIISDCYSALQINSSMDSIYSIMINPIIEKKGKLEAIRILDDGLKNNNNSSVIYLLRGLIKYGLEDYISAESDFKLSIEKNTSKDSYAQLFLGKAKFRNSDYYGAIYSLNKALEIDSNEKESYFWRAACHSKLKKYQDAIDDYTNSINKDEEHKSQAFQNRGISYGNLGFNLKAYEDLKKACNLGVYEACDLAKEYRKK